jgi:hypothetical protein
MKVIISEEQLRQIIESEDKRKLFKVPVDFLITKTDAILNNYKKKGFDGIIVDGTLYGVDLEYGYIDEVLKNIVKIDGNLHVGISFTLSSLYELEKVMGNLYMTSNERIESLGQLKYVGGSLILRGCKRLESFGELEYVGGDLIIAETPLVKYSDEDIREKINVQGDIIR